MIDFSTMETAMFQTILDTFAMYKTNELPQIAVIWRLCEEFCGGDLSGGNEKALEAELEELALVTYRERLYIDRQRLMVILKADTSESAPGDAFKDAEKRVRASLNACNAPKDLTERVIAELAKEALKGDTSAREAEPSEEELNIPECERPETTDLMESVYNEILERLNTESELAVPEEEYKLKTLESIPCFDGKLRGAFLHAVIFAHADVLDLGAYERNHVITKRGDLHVNGDTHRA